MKYRRQQQRPDGDVELRGFDHSAMELPPCEACGGVLKPGVVLFGENVPAARVQGAAPRVSKLCGPFWLRFPYVTLVFSRNIEGRHARAGAMAALARSDALLLLGTSCQVFSAFRFVRAAAAAEIPVAVVNVGETRADPLASLVVQGQVGHTIIATVLRRRG
jgi:NAD-dependent SIR2 family protein deacetylase